jgi:hypothetical protein
VAWLPTIAVDADNKSLEDIAIPLSVIAAERYPNDPRAYRKTGSSSGCVGA